MVEGQAGADGIPWYPLEVYRPEVGCPDAGVPEWAPPVSAFAGAILPVQSAPERLSPGREYPAKSAPERLPAEKIFPAHGLAGQRTPMVRARHGRNRAP